MGIDEAIVRQWVRDNKSNLGWTFAGCNSGNLVFALACSPESADVWIADEIGDKFTDWRYRKDFSQLESLGLHLCRNCRSMIADPIESADAGGHLCPGCMRWYELSTCKNPRELKWSCMNGRAGMWLQIDDQMNKAKAKADEQNKQFWRNLRRKIHGKSKTAKKIAVETDDRDYDNWKQSCWTSIEEVRDGRI